MSEPRAPGRGECDACGGPYWSGECYTVPTVAAALSLEKIRDALVLSLAVDGYIDIEGLDGEQYLHGDLREYSVYKIEAAAKSLHRFLVMDPAELESQRLKVLARRHEEGRD